MYTLTERMRILWKWLLSFARSDWTFDDYPVRVRRNEVPDPAIAWMAQILNWPGPLGLGATREVALRELQSNFEQIIKSRREAGEPAPRPGAKEPIRFAASHQVDADPKLRDDFIQRVLGFAPNDPVFISDQSSLFDFGDKNEVERLAGLIRSNYGIETSDLKEAIIADILQRIVADRAKSG
jgi:predicted RNase H-like HicB family nuclease